jgi:hypothetical protein
MPSHQRLGPDDSENLQDRRKPAIHLDKKPEVNVGQAHPSLRLTPRNDQLMSERRILWLKPDLRIEWRRQNGQHETHQRDHDVLTLGDSFG